MTQVGEKLNAALEKSLKDDEYCDNKKSDSTNWEARINDWGTNKNCSAPRLFGDMERVNNSGKKEGYLGPPKPFVAKPGVVGYQWDMKKCNKSHFPLQAHHIIPKNHLPLHGVCTFLAMGYTKSKKYKLTADTPYDTDHNNNGYCMPYATPLAEWKSAKDDDDKTEVCNKIMDKTGRQLHQGSHKGRGYQADPPVADEETGIHADIPGYLDTINDFLDTVQQGAINHLEKPCTVCKPAAGKKEIQPLEAVVRHMDQVSGLVKLLADANIIFVSEPAYDHWGKKRKRVKTPGFLK
jgi:hypothetical protein